MRQMTHDKHVMRKPEKRLVGLFSGARSRGEAMMERARERGSDMIEDAQSSGRVAWKDAKGWVARNPGWALGSAFVAGTLIRTFIRRRGE